MKVIACKKRIYTSYSIKFTNIKYFRGGGKCPLRIRKGQNYTLHYGQYPPPNLSDEEWINKLYSLTKGRIIITSSTKVIKKIEHY